MGVAPLLQGRRVIHNRLSFHIVIQVLELIEEQMTKIDHRLDCLLLVGGFSGMFVVPKQDCRHRCGSPDVVFRQ